MMSENPAQSAQSEQSQASQASQAGATRPQDPPLLVAATVGESTAVWQVEVDARVLLGDFSGAWLVDQDGVHGFAADADWIEQRADRHAVRERLLARPVVVAGDTQDATLARLPQSAQVVDLEATLENATAELERNKEQFAEENPGKRQPAWGEISFAAQDGPAPQGLTGDAAAAVTACMATARGVRWLVRDWNAAEKLRAQRLGGELRALPVVLR
ncbi:N-acetylglucosamine-6-phosphate deacetylase [Corynebacterium sp.]|uniref:N-acetylglucosamine-6-phosphate deacetylase n=1 Tax=Corynebacterium sp. TaxID=1720 RepID=UPI002647023D|nr:N-acetylglucosamine-6-phosphate deacetylase [Corynebacterium sp.]MDN6375255.1 N-acetylglucosamine-6-phosphate deacetylase [Corynebacterium sp.]